MLLLLLNRLSRDFNPQLDRALFGHKTVECAVLQQGEQADDIAALGPIKIRVVRDLESYESWFFDDRGFLLSAPVLILKSRHLHNSHQLHNLCFRLAKNELLHGLKDRIFV